jgi:FAD binding domain-containing protein/berberine-like enzyme
MSLVTRRRFVQGTAFAAAALYGRPLKLLGGRRIFVEREQNAAPVDAAAIRKLGSQITGHVITPEAADYEPSRLVGNRAYDRHPALIVRCASASDVTRALDFGQSQSLPLAVRAGGHSAAGFGVCDGGLVIDLSGMKRVEVDADKRVARAEAGSLVGDVDKATQHFGLATTLGTCPTVGIAGLTLGGGLGFLMSKYGTACDNLLSARVVTVDGRQLEASQNSNPDLFWAIRGGGGNFGVATALEYQLHPVSEILVGALIFPAGRIPELLQAYAKFTGAAPDEMSTTAMILPSEQGPRIRMLVGYCGQATVGNDLLKPLREPLKPPEDTVKAMSYLEAQAKAFPVSPKPSAYFVTNLFLPELHEAAVAAITTATQDVPQRFRVMIGQYHGVMTRVRPSDMAFPLRERGYEVEVSSYWSAPGEKTSVVQWVNALRDNLQSFSHGLNANKLSDTSGEIVRAAYGPNYARLAEIKKKYDPTNVLRLNPNIRPEKLSNN